MEVAEAACIAHGLLDHMHGLIHGLAPLLLALRGHICTTTLTKGKTGLNVSCKANCSVQICYNLAVSALVSVHTL